MKSVSLTQYLKIATLIIPHAKRYIYCILSHYFLYEIMKFQRNLYENIFHFIGYQLHGWWRISVVPDIRFVF